MAEQTNPNYYGSPKLQCPPAYLKTIHGKLKIPEMILSILVFALSFSVYYSGAGWVEFAGFWTFVEVTIWFVLHSVDIIPRIAWNYMVFFAFAAMVICGYDGYLQVLEYRARRANAEAARNPGQFDASIPDQPETSPTGQPESGPSDPPGYDYSQPEVVRTTTMTVVTQYVTADRRVMSPPASSVDLFKLLY